MTDPLLWREPVRDEWIDYNQHLSEAYYVLVLGHGTDHVLEHIGIGAEYRARTHGSFFTVEAHIRYLDQVPAGAELEVHSWVTGSTAKLLRIWHELYVEGTLRASEEILGLHVDTDTGRSTPFPESVVQRIQEQQTTPPLLSGSAISLEVS